MFGEPACRAPSHKGGSTTGLSVTDASVRAAAGDGLMYAVRHKSPEALLGQNGNKRRAREHERGNPHCVKAPIQPHRGNPRQSGFQIGQQNNPRKNRPSIRYRTQTAGPRLIARPLKMRCNNLSVESGFAQYPTTAELFTMLKSNACSQGRCHGRNNRCRSDNHRRGCGRRRDLPRRLALAPHARTSEVAPTSTKAR